MTGAETADSRCYDLGDDDSYKNPLSCYDVCLGGRVQRVDHCKKPHAALTSAPLDDTCASGDVPLRQACTVCQVLVMARAAIRLTQALPT